MSYPHESFQPGEGRVSSLRQRLGLRGELMLALLPTATALAVFAFVEVLSQQRLLFASLASSAFLIYLDPQHGMNSVRTLVVAHFIAAGLGFGTFIVFGPGYLAGGAAMLGTVVLMIVFDTVHPPAVSTSLSFAFRAGGASNLLLFALAVGITVLLVGLEQVAVWLAARQARRAKT